MAAKKGIRIFQWYRSLPRRGGATIICERFSSATGATDRGSGQRALCARRCCVFCRVSTLHSSLAAATWRRAIALYEGLKSPYDEQMFFRACCHAGLGDLGNRPGSGVSAAEGRAETEQAMNWLRKAATAGYSNPDSFRIESALDPLRGREDFKKLMAELEAKSKAGTK